MHILDVVREAQLHNALSPPRGGQPVYHDMQYVGEREVVRVTLGYDRIEPMTLYGTPVHINPHTVVRRPAREHKRGKHSEAYHARIQKKWNKRFGYVTEDQVWVTEEAIFMSQANYQLLLRECTR